MKILAKFFVKQSGRDEREAYIFHEILSFQK